MELSIYQVDSFTQEAFKGNPAGVCITEHGIDASLMMSIAAEMAVSETAFLSLNDMKLRWFTPKTEVKLCGHGTLAVAHILKENYLVTSDESVTFETLSGPLTVNFQPTCIEMNFPTPRLNFELEINLELLRLMGIKPEQVISYCRFDEKDFIEVENEQIVLSLAPNFDGLKQVTGRGVVVTAIASDKPVDFVSRYFAPWVGINEDPVTGSAHCALAAYWGDKLGLHKLKAYQASERGGCVEIELLGNHRVKLIGTAVTVLKGVLCI